jgi:hypothetical protein
MGIVIQTISETEAELPILFHQDFNNVLDVLRMARTATTMRVDRHARLVGENGLASRVL